MGAAGDMIMGALLELYPNPDEFIKIMNNIFGSLYSDTFISISYSKTQKCGIIGTSISIKINGKEENEYVHNHDHAHQKYNDHNCNDLKCITDLINSLLISEKVKENAIAIYKIIAEAEAKAHNKPVNSIHFHEVGEIDAICDIVGCCLLIELLSVENIIVSPICLGNGFVQCAHGLLPVPAPATCNILTGVPVYSGTIQGELCTPTGAAILKYFANRFENMPIMTIYRIGYGMGKKDFCNANCIRSYLGEVEILPIMNDNIIEISCNLDDMTGEAIGYVFEKLLVSNVLDVFTTPITMKKSRPAVMLTTLCEKKYEDEISKLILKHTTTIGVRIKECRRQILNREIEERDTKYGKIKFKKAYNQDISKQKPEYEDIKRVADENNLAFYNITSKLQ
jgi:uncharacterized protein (TIGR00299 family) protein